MSDFAEHEPTIDWTFTGLTPGVHTVSTYAWVSGTSSDVSIPGVPLEQVIGPPTWPLMGQIIPQTYVTQTVTVAGPLVITTSIAAGGSGGVNGFQLTPASPMVGTCYCTPAVPNSTGAPATITGFGSGSILANNLVLTASSCPVGEFGFCIYGPVQSFWPAYNGFNFLGNPIGRFFPATAIGASEASTLAIDNANLPAGGPAFLPCMTMSFQFFYHDTAATSGFANFTDALAVVLTLL